MSVIITLKKMLREHDGEEREGEMESESKREEEILPAAGERYDNLRPPLSENELLYFIYKGGPHH